jgi:tryptophanyl-tRNA synthetase
MTRLSAITPSGHAHVGNYLGAVRRWAREGSPGDLYLVSDLHAMTTPYHPQKLRARSRELLAVLVASGIEPDQVFVQSDLARELGALTWLLECTCAFGEAARMTQFKEKSTGDCQSAARVGLFTYPVLMAADVLLYRTHEVPVGDDQRQHIELMRDIAERFNSRFGNVLVVPEGRYPEVGARVMDLQDPETKMSTTGTSEQGTVYVLDEPAVVTKKLKSAVTDSGAEVVRAPDKGGISNLIEILAAVRGSAPEEVEREFDGSGYGDFK